MKFVYLIEPPFNFRNDDGQILGCDVALAMVVCSKLGMGSFDPVEAEFADLLPGLALGKWKMTTGLFATEEREEIASFSRPIWALPDGLLVKRGNPFEITGYQSVATHESCILAVIRDQFQHHSAIEFGVPDARIMVFDTYTKAANAVQSGLANAYASVGRAHTGFLEQNTRMDLEVVVVSDSEKKPAFGAFGFAKDDAEFRRSVNQILEKYIGSVEHRKMMAEYGFSRDEIDLLIQ